MKLKLWNIILLSTLILGCQSKVILDGNYSVCLNGEYVEVYFKKNLMRVATENESRTLHEWQKIEIKQDTLYFESFDEWKHNWKAKIIRNGKSKTELHNLNTDMKFQLEPINAILKFENQKEFWNKFNIRKEARNCE